MALLRDARTSALVAEGTPLQVALAARELGRADVLFDDVGEGFDPDAVIAAHEDNVDGLAAAAKAERGEAKKCLDAAVKAARADADVDDLVAEAQPALEAARAAVDE